MANPAEITIVDSPKGSVANTASQNLDTNGDIPIKVGNAGGKDLLLIVVNNSTTQKVTVKIKAGNSRASLTSKELLFELPVKSQTGSSVQTSNLESARFLQNDGTFTLNVQAAAGAPAVAVACYRLTR